MRPFNCSVFVLAALLAGESLVAQEGRSGRLTGVVKDSLGAVIPGAEVVATNEATKATFKATADDKGSWAIARIPAATYTVTIKAPSTVPTVLRGTAVTADATTTADAELRVGISETVVVTASKVEQLLVDAPAQVTIVGDRRIASQPTQDFADIMREVPGVNVVQMSARDFNVTPRAATNVPAASQLVMVDGRPINQDYYGYVAWDFLPTTMAEVKQIEVLRGAASSVWGDYAMNGVVNIQTKSPREMAGSAVTLGAGTFDRSGGVAYDKDGKVSDSNGLVYYLNASHAQVLNERWAFKLSGGYVYSDPLARPTGTIPNDFHTPYPAFRNFGAKQPKVDARVDYDSPDGRQHLSLSGGYARTGGTFHTGLGPFRLEDNAHGAYAKVDYRTRGWEIKSFVNLWGGEASSLLAVGPLGSPLLLNFSDKSWDIDAQRTQTIGTKNTLTYGANYRHTWTDVTMAPLGKKRDLVGGFLQDEIFFSDHFRAVLGGRIDKYDVLSDPVLSPRVAFLIKPMPEATFRLSYSRAYRAPSLFQNHLDTVVANRMDLGLLNPALAGNYYFFPVAGKGNLDLKEQTLDAYEIGYTSSLAKGRIHAGASFFLTNSRHDMILGQSGSYSSQNMPPNWPVPCPVPGGPAGCVLDLLIANNAFGPGLGLPSVLSFQNLGEVRNKGFEASVDAQPHRYFSVFANYSWQAKPTSPDNSVLVDPASKAGSKINLPPTNRFNGGVNVDYKLFSGSISVGYTSKAYFRDVLDVSYAGWTEAFTVVNASVGVRLPGDHGALTVKVRNLANEPVQNHLFGDFLRRQIVGELTLRR